VKYIRLRAYIILFTICFVSLLLSCKEEQIILDSDIHGHWEVIAAKRNGKLTATLKDAYFTFNDERIFSTNIYGEPKDFDFELDSDKIMQSGDQSSEFKIMSLQNDTLHLSSRMLNYNFDFLAVKSDSIL